MNNTETNPAPAELPPDSSDEYSWEDLSEAIRTGHALEAFDEYKGEEPGKEDSTAQLEEYRQRRFGEFEFTIELPSPRWEHQGDGEWTLDKASWPGRLGAYENQTEEYKRHAAEVNEEVDELLRKAAGLGQPEHESPTEPEVLGRARHPGPEDYAPEPEDDGTDDAERLKQMYRDAAEAAYKRLRALGETSDDYEMQEMTVQDLVKLIEEADVDSRAATDAAPGGLSGGPGQGSPLSLVSAGSQSGQVLHGRPDAMRTVALHEASQSAGDTMSNARAYDEIRNIFADKPDSRRAA